jgi:beta-glucuronidase
VPGLAAGEHEIAVRVDNSFGAHSALHISGNDYYSYGGITRPVELQWVPEVFLSQMALTTEPDMAATDSGTWSLKIDVELRNLSALTHKRQLTVELEGLDVRLEFEAEIGPNQTLRLSRDLSGLAAEPWTTGTPRLYYVQALLLHDGEAVDDLRDRIGFRTVQVCGSEILLNGEVLRLRGYNRHEDHPQFGSALPLEAMAIDLELIRDMGCNFVRTAHYPNDRRFLDLCDEMGFYVWEESHARQTPFQHPLFREQIATATREMVESHRNHPSIIMWGCLNECDSASDAGREVYAEVLGLLRRLDTSRPVTFASDKAQRDKCLDLVDIVSWNRYVGWYTGGIYEVESLLNELLEWLDSEQSGGAGKPVILSEFGADGFYGYRRGHHAKGTEEFQVELLDESLRVYLNHPRVSGAAIWQFTDVRVDPGHFHTRGMCMNTKGTFDEYRRPKLVCEAVKRRMKEARTGGYPASGDRPNEDP